MSKRIVGVYGTGIETIVAVKELRERGYQEEDISVVAKDWDELRDVEEATGTNTEEGFVAGATAGGVFGGTAGLLAGIGALAIPGIGPILAAGPIVAALAGVAVGAGTGGLAGALIGMGIPEDEANRYESDIKNGKLLVLVEDHKGVNELGSVDATSDYRNPNEGLTGKRVQEGTITDPRPGRE